MYSFKKLICCVINEVHCVNDNDVKIGRVENKAKLVLIMIGVCQGMEVPSACT